MSTTEYVKQSVEIQFYPKKYIFIVCLRINFDTVYTRMAIIRLKFPINTRNVRQF